MKTPYLDKQIEELEWTELNSVATQSHKDELKEFYAIKEALSIHLVMWRCTKDLFMDRGEKVFTKGKLYKQIEFNCDSAINDKGEEHIFGEWSDFFIAT